MNPKTGKKNENCAVLREQQTVLSNLIEIPEFDRRISNIEYDLVILPEGFYPFPSRTRKSRPPGPMILGSQDPGKVGRRQVNKQKTISYGVVFCVSYTVRTKHRGSTRSDPHCWSLRHESQCGESLIRLSSHCWSLRYVSQCGDRLIRLSYPEHGSQGSTLLECAL